MAVIQIFTSLLELFLLLTLICLILSLYPTAPNTQQESKAPVIRSKVELSGPLSQNQRLDEPTKIFTGQLEQYP